MPGPSPSPELWLSPETKALAHVERRAGAAVPPETPPSCDLSVMLPLSSSTFLFGGGLCSARTSLNRMDPLSFPSELVGCLQ